MKGKLGSCTKKMMAPKNGKKKHKSRFDCQCIWSFLSSIKTKQEQRNSSGTISKKETLMPETLEKTRDIASVAKHTKKIRINRIPRNGCGIELLVKLFTNLSKSGAIHMDEAEIMKASNITFKAKKDLDEGKQWNGHIQLAENLELKLYKSGLVLYHISF